MYLLSMAETEDSLRIALKYLHHSNSKDAPP